MTIVTNAAIINAIVAQLEADFPALRVQGPSNITEGIPQVPLLQIYPESGEAAAGQQTDQNTFQRGLVISSLTLVMDLYARKRSEIGTDMEVQLEWIDHLDQWLLELDRPYFGIDVVQALKWQWTRSIFTYNNNETFAGSRFTLSITCF
jgi:hypothetical protein